MIMVANAEGSYKKCCQTGIWTEFLDTSQTKQPRYSIPNQINNPAYQFHAFVFKNKWYFRLTEMYAQAGSSKKLELKKKVLQNVNVVYNCYWTDYVIIAIECTVVLF